MPTYGYDRWTGFSATRGSEVLYSTSALPLWGRGSSPVGNSAESPPSPPVVPGRDPRPSGADTRRRRNDRTRVLESQNASLTNQNEKLLVQIDKLTSIAAHCASEVAALKKTLCDQQVYITSLQRDIAAQWMRSSAAEGALLLAEQESKAKAGELEDQLQSVVWAHDNLKAALAESEHARSLLAGRDAQVADLHGQLASLSSQAPATAGPAALLAVPENAAAAPQTPHVSRFLLRGAGLARSSPPQLKPSSPSQSQTSQQSRVNGAASRQPQQTALAGLPRGVGPPTRQPQQEAASAQAPSLGPRSSPSARTGNSVSAFRRV